MAKVTYARLRSGYFGSFHVKGVALRPIEWAEVTDIQLIEYLKTLPNIELHEEEEKEEETRKAPTPASTVVESDEEEEAEEEEEEEEEEEKTQKSSSIPTHKTKPKGVPSSTKGGMISGKPNRR